MLISLIVGILLGGVAVLFALQNTATITVVFLSWDITAPLSFLLLACLLGGIIATLLALIPFLFRDELAARNLRREKKTIEDEYAKYRADHPAQSSGPVSSSERWTADR